MSNYKWLLEKPEEHPKYFEYIDKQNNCELCGTKLELMHSYEANESKIKEIARCPHCEIKTKPMSHYIN